MAQVTVSYACKLPHDLELFIAALRDVQTVCPPGATILKLTRAPFVPVHSEPFVPPGWDLVVEWLEERT